MMPAAPIASKTSGDDHGWLVLNNMRETPLALI